MHIFPKKEDELDDISIVGVERFLADDPKTKTYISFKEAFVPIEKGYLDKLSNFYQATAGDLISLDVINESTNQQMLFSHLFNNTDKGWVKAGIIGLQQNYVEDHSSQYLPRLLKQMKYISRLQ